MANYNADDITDGLDNVTPVEGSTPPSEVNNAIREIKKVINNLFTARTITGSTANIAETDAAIIADSTSNNIALTLPALASRGATVAKGFTIIKTSAANTVTIDDAAGELINGAAQLTLNALWSVIHIFTDGSTWYAEGQVLDAPTIASYVNANHDHADAAGGGDLGDTTATSLATDTITEETAANGVDVDGCLIKDGGVAAVTDQGGGANLKTKVIEIGDWNMDATTTLTIAHGLTWTKVRHISALIRNDADAENTDFNYYDAAGTDTGGIQIDATEINLRRPTAGFFDNNGFASTSYNRGWVTITYEE
jgi:hypothetical protein